MFQTGLFSKLISSFTGSCCMFIMVHSVYFLLLKLVWVKATRNASKTTAPHL